MNVKVRFVLVSLALITFSTLPTHACVTTNDLSGGGWETSDASDPCASVLPFHAMANTSLKYVSAIQTVRPHSFALGHLPKQNGMSPFLFLPLLALCFGLNRKDPEISVNGEIWGMREAGL